MDVKLDGRLVHLSADVRPGGIVLQAGDLRIEVALEALGPGQYCARIGARVYPVTVVKLPGESLWSVRVRETSYRIEVIDRGVRRRWEAQSGEDIQRLVARMPGKVVKVLKGPGEPVEAHQGILVVEAMKMQNEVRALGRGRVKEISVSVGQTVNAGDLLALVEPLSEARS